MFSQVYRFSRNILVRKPFQEGPPTDRYGNSSRVKFATCKTLVFPAVVLHDVVVQAQKKPGFKVEKLAFSSLGLTFETGWCFQVRVVVCTALPRTAAAHRPPPTTQTGPPSLPSCSDARLRQKIPGFKLKAPSSFFTIKVCNRGAFKPGSSLHRPHCAVQRDGFVSRPRGEVLAAAV